MKKVVILLTLILAVISLALGLGKGKIVSATSPLASEAWSTPKVISTGVANAKRAVLKADPSNPGKLMVLFISMQSNDTTAIDPYFTVSQDFGVNWSTPALVHESPSLESKQINFDFDDQGTAHAAWLEGRGLAYANSANWSTSFQTLSNPNGDPGVTTPAVATFGSNIHIVWSEGNTNDPNPIKTVPNILYTRSKDRGATWLAEPMVLTNTGLDSVSPAITVDPAGNVHIVWQEYKGLNDTNNRLFDIKYVKGTVSENSVSWSTPITITSLITSSSYFSTEEPQLRENNGEIQVTTTVIYQQPAEQYIYLLKCRANCTNLSNWTNKNSISGQSLYVNVEPFYLGSSHAELLGCDYIFFDGASPDNTQDKEQIWMANSCFGWTNQPKTITTADIRALRPSTDSLNNWLYLTYEKEVQTESGNANQIYFLSNESDYGAYLPMLRR
ncbi:MAG: exo-alpha-sialidase [Chloroflexi bacterium]|nr:exo-alpha-sialidase [Chloroflexota bacterium]